MDVQTSPDSLAYCLYSLWLSYILELPSTSQSPAVIAEPSCPFCPRDLSVKVITSEDGNLNAGITVYTVTNYIVLNICYIIYYL